MKNWKFDRELTENQTELLKKVNFPMFDLKHNQVLQRRIKRINANGGYADNPNISIEDLVYVVVPKKIADTITLNVQQTLKEKNIDLRRTKDKSSLHDYFYLSEIDTEMDRILRKYGEPTPTPSMKKEPEKEVKEETIEVVKNLSNVDKGKVKKLAQEDLKDANEIAKELGLDLDRVIKYLKTL